jgi:hypothetical protein
MKIETKILKLVLFMLCISAVPFQMQAMDAPAEVAEVVTETAAKGHWLIRQLKSYLPSLPSGTDQQIYKLASQLDAVIGKLGATIKLPSAAAVLGAVHKYPLSSAAAALGAVAAFETAMNWKEGKEPLGWLPQRFRWRNYKWRGWRQLPGYEANREANKQAKHLEEAENKQAKHLEEAWNKMEQEAFKATTEKAKRKQEAQKAKLIEKEKLQQLGLKQRSKSEIKQMLGEKSSYDL